VSNSTHDRWSLAPSQPLTPAKDDVSVHRASSLRHIVVVGAGGHGRELADIVRFVGEATHEVSLLGLIDDGEVDRLALARAGFRFLGSRDVLEGRNVDIHLGLGFPAIRKRIDLELGARTAQPMIHPSATIGSACHLNDGVVLAQNAVITTNVTLGRHTHLNVRTSVSHDCVVGDYVTICPQVTITGGVTIGSGVFVGAGATVLPGITIGEHSIIGAGAVVTADVAAGQTVAGVPAHAIG